ncbi:uncharacterized protein JN550_005155 [Neoarthrinium moseri]|uniref:uncharacterized protein n=1 Tax=Neoarthrinium moseri TaxID=1658444 RepID=UPI001FDD162F|nr:uncharacterized protein JN550_005155 [Neoarthrinium moseri]KAI1870612.1 hypothetical protein JN550_005155 [Neoarthrinium moseri]
MSDTQLADTSTPLGQWVDELFKNIFFQPNDAHSMIVFDAYIAPDLVVRINHSLFTRDSWREATNTVRAGSLLTMDSNDEVAAWQAPGQSGAGCVAHMSHFTQRSKQDREATSARSLTLANVAIREGKRCLVELTEIAT